MTNKRKRKSGYRQPPPPGRAEPGAAKAQARSKTTTERRPGLFGGLLGSAIPASMSEMPYYRDSLGRGFLLAGSVPVLVLVPMLWVFASWMALLALGYVGTPGFAFAEALALPPISVGFDVQNASALFGQQAGPLVGVPFLVVRALLVAILAGLTVEAFETGGRVSSDGVRRGLKGAPIVMAALILGMLSVLVAQFAGFFGAGFGALLSVVIPAVGLWLLGFVPFVAVRDRPPLSVALQRAYLGARTPGGRQFLFSMLYLVVYLIIQFAVPGRLITANPGFSTWVGGFFVTYVHMGFFAAFAYRWLSIEHTVTGA